MRCAGGAVQDVTFRNVPSYVLARDVPVATPFGALRVDVAYGGAIYASVPAAAAGLAVDPAAYGDLIALGRAIKAALAGTEHARHPSDDRLSGVYGTIVFDDLGDATGGPHQRNVTVFADGEVDRSPCGSGTTARARNVVPTIESWRSTADPDRRPSACSSATRADVPEPHGERSTSPSANTVTLRWCGPSSVSPNSSWMMVP